MKRNVILLSAGVLSIGLMAFGYAKLKTSSTEKCQALKQQKAISNYYIDINTKDEVFTDFFYDFGSRFGMTISKSKLQAARTVADILPPDDLKNIESYKSVNVIIIKNDEQTDIRSKGYSDKLTDAQLKLLRSMDYSTNFLLRTDFESNSNETRDGYNYITPHFTVVPEKQAEYIEGKDALLNFIKTANKKFTINLDEKKLSPAKLYFTISKTGTVENINLDRSCGYSNIDTNMIEYIIKSAGKWIPAENEKGEKVEQELVLSFGRIGC